MFNLVSSGVSLRRNAPRAGTWAKARTKATDNGCIVPGACDGQPRRASLS